MLADPLLALDFLLPFAGESSVFCRLAAFPAFVLAVLLPLPLPAGFAGSG